MRYVNEYRDERAAQALVRSIKDTATKRWTIMEICGGQTHSIVRFGIDSLLADTVEFVHGPGCPVCVTPIHIIDKAVEIASNPKVIFCSFGDMLRVPGTDEDLFSVKSKGGDVRIVYSPLDALKTARENPEKEVVFFAVGFETTAPANAMAAYQAKREGIKNFSLLVSHVLVPPAMEAILSDPDRRIQGFLAAGHVCTVMGTEEYGPIAKKYRVPIVVTGFEPVDVLEGVAACVKQLEEGRYEVENRYARSVRSEGNREAQALIRKVFTVTDRQWRGIGTIPQSGLALSRDYSGLDAEERFGASHPTEETGPCIGGEVLKGHKKPSECPAFGKECVPENPLGAMMVSSEGACSAYYRYRGLAESTVKK